MRVKSNAKTRREVLSLHGLQSKVTGILVSGFSYMVLGTRDNPPLEETLLRVPVDRVKANPARVFITLIE